MLNQLEIKILGDTKNEKWYAVSGSLLSVPRKAIGCPKIVIFMFTENSPKGLVYVIFESPWIVDTLTHFEFYVKYHWF